MSNFWLSKSERQFSEFVLAQFHLQPGFLEQPTFLRNEQRRRNSHPRDAHAQSLASRYTQRRQNYGNDDSHRVSTLSIPEAAAIPPLVFF